MLTLSLVRPGAVTGYRAVLNKIMLRTPRGGVIHRQGRKGAPREFCTNLSTENVNKIGGVAGDMFITWQEAVGYPGVIPDERPISSGLPPVGSVKQSSHMHLRLFEVVR